MVKRGKWLHQEPNVYSKSDPIQLISVFRARGMWAFIPRARKTGLLQVLPNLQTEDS
jgi:hypothetical protein